MRMPTVRTQPAQMRHILALMTDMDAKDAHGTYKFKRGVPVFATGSLEAWLRVLNGLAKNERTAGDNPDNFAKFQYAVKRNIRAFEQTLRARNGDVVRAYKIEVYGDDDKQAFCDFVRRHIPEDPRYIINENSMVDAARYCLHGITGFCDYITRNPDAFEYFEQLGILRRLFDAKATDAERAGARTIDAMVDDILMFSREDYEPVDGLRRVPKICKPFAVSAKDAEALEWLFF